MNLPEQPLGALLSRYRARPAQERFRLVLFWGVLVLCVLVIGLTGYHAARVSGNLESKVRELFADRPWVSGLVVVNGRDVLLVGEVEPGSDIERDMDMIARIDGVRSVTNRLSEQPKPSAHFVLSRTGRDLEMAGRMSGDDLETVAALVRNAFPGHGITDRVHVDDRLGRPVWLDGFSSGLDALASIGNFELNGWRDQLDVVGITADGTAALRTGYAIPASLGRQVTVRNRLAPETAIGFPIVSITSDWRSLHIEGTVPTRSLRNRLIAACRSAFGAKVSHDISVDPVRAQDSALRRVMALLPALARVRNLRLISSGDGFTAWGEVDSPHLLGSILNARRQLGLESLVTNRIEVAPVTRPASLALFSDRARAVASGVLPSVKTKEVLFRTISDTLQVERVVDLVSVEPGVAQSDWLDSWAGLLSLLTGNVLGITIDDRNLLLTGTVPDQEQYDRIDARIAELLPDIRTINWLVPADD